MGGFEIVCMSAVVFTGVVLVVMVTDLLRSDR